MKRAIWIAAGLFAAAIAAVGQTSSGKDVVSPSAFASYDPVARGGNLQVAVVMKIKPGFHVNAREVTEDYLIKTDLKVGDAQGFKAGDVTYPKGSLQKFAFSKDKALNVYTDSVTLRVPITVTTDAPTGAQHVPLKLRYQACSNEICLPPVTLPVDAAINVVADRKDAHTANAAVFAH